jgi:ABC-2 type transport system ATP-binding protein
MDPAKGGASMTENILSIRQLRVDYGARQVLQGIDLQISPGEWFSLLGPNGSGKTTLLRCVSGQLIPASGSVLICKDSVLDAPDIAKRHLGFAHPPEQLPELLTGRQCLEVYAGAHDLPDIGAPTLELAARLRLEHALDRTVETYSLGMRQKLSILLALVNDPRLIVLDESFNGLDPASALLVKRDLQDRVANRHCAVLLATHALDLVMRYSTRAALLLDGVITKAWDNEELDFLRSRGDDVLESELASAAGVQRV